MTPRTLIQADAAFAHKEIFMLAVSERVPGYGRTPDQTIWHKPAPGHRCTGDCDFHPIACSAEEGIVMPASKQNVPLRLNKENERWCTECGALNRAS